MKANQKHNFKFNYNKVNYIGTHKKVKITCKIHGDFLQMAYEHLAGRGCPKCSTNNKSKKEKLWLDSLNVPIKNRNVFLKINNKKYNVDGLDLLNNTIYEFNGDYWHGNPKIFNSKDLNKNNKTTFGSLYKKTILKEKAFIDAGYKVVSIWEADWDAMK